MNEKQIAWVNNKIKKMTDKIDNIGALNLTDQDWESVANYMEQVTKLAKGFEREVAAMQIKAIEPYCQQCHDEWEANRKKNAQSTNDKG